MKIGSTSNRTANKPSLKTLNDAWNASRKRGIQKGIDLSNQVSNTVFSVTTNLSEQQTSNALRGSNISVASAMSRLNILV